MTAKLTSEGVQVSRLTRGDIRRIARVVRERFGMEGTGRLPVMHIAEFELGLVVPNYRFRVIAEEEMPNMLGYFNPATREMSIRSDIYNSGDEDPNSRLTIAHEIGHAVMHFDQLRLAKSVSDAANLPQQQQSEWQADVFAVEFLIDPMIAKRYLMPKNLAYVSGVPLDIAKLQLKVLARDGMLMAEKHKDLRNVSQQRFDFDSVSRRD